MLILNKDDVLSIIKHLENKDLIENQRKTFIEFSSNSNVIQNPSRTIIKSNEHNLLYMPSRVDENVAMKVVAVPLPDATNETKRGGLPATSIVMDVNTGVTEAIVNATELTALRTAAGSILGTSLFIPKSSNIRNIVVFGTGKQAYHHARIMFDYYKDSIKCLTYVKNKSDGHYKHLFDFVDRDIQNKIITRGDIYNYISEADIIICCTPSLEPLFDSSKVKSDVHLVLVGSYKPEMQEVDTLAIRNAIGSIIVDSRHDCSREAGEFINAHVDLSRHSNQAYELGYLLNQTQSVIKNGVSIYKSVGIGIQDSSIARLIVDKSKQMKIGQNIDFN